MKFSIKISSEKRVLVSIENFTIENNKINFLFGESGIGKTLIAKSVLGLINDNELRVEINGEQYGEYKKNLGVGDMIAKSFYVFQEPSAHLSPVQRISNQLKEGKLRNAPEKKTILKNLFPFAQKGKTDELLRLYPKPFRPSGGEKQRLLNAMAFIAMSKLNFSNAWNSLFVFDEPTGHLDVKLRNVLIDELIFRFIKDKPAVLFITHDYSLISYVETRYAELCEFFEYFEIKKENETLMQHRFSPDNYLKWITTRKFFPVVAKGESTALKIKSRINVFDKTLKIFEDETRNNEVPIVIKKGEAVYLKAASGEGKTTLVKILLGLIPAKFEAEIDGIKIHGNTGKSFFKKHVWGKKLTLAFQHADEALNPNATVKETFEALKLPENNGLNRMFEILFEENKRLYDNKKIKHLSGGQKQKINLLRSLVLNCAVTILDEPLNGIDFSGSQKVLDLLEEQIKQGKTFLIISHNEDIFDKVIERKYYLTSERTESNEL